VPVRVIQTLKKRSRDCKESGGDAIQKEISTQTTVNHLSVICLSYMGFDALFLRAGSYCWPAHNKIMNVTVSQIVAGGQCCVDS
jgi:hypothetical protein